MIVALLGTPAAAAKPGDWRAAITAHDRVRLRGWRAAWTDALARAQASGAGARIAAEGALLDPDAALDRPAPPDGDYRCRTIKLGAQNPAGLDYVTYPAATCRIRDGRFKKIDGSQRPIGALFASDDNRLLFLGSLALGDEPRALDYGHDADRDMIGVIERIGPRRWRLVLPYPRRESLIEIYELVPAGS